MIAGIFQEGSGLGDQLFRYITVRTLAEEKGFEFSMVNPLYFKGRDFMELDMGEPHSLQMKGWNEKVVRDEDGIDIRSYDPEINFVEDNTCIDGSFEDSKYWHHNLKNINEWLRVEPVKVVSDNTCLIGFRGGEYYSDPNLGLPTSYFEEAVKKMHVINPEMKFEVHTDDPKLAELMLTPVFGTNSNKITYIPNERISHSKHLNMGFNWWSMRLAKYAIIPNSAFFIMPRILKHFEDPTAVTIAPRYWARRNTQGPWRPAAYYKEFTYI